MSIQGAKKNSRLAKLLAAGTDDAKSGLLLSRLQTLLQSAPAAESGVPNGIFLVKQHTPARYTTATHSYWQLLGC